MVAKHYLLPILTVLLTFITSCSSSDYKNCTAGDPPEGYFKLIVELPGTDLVNVQLSYDDQLDSVIADHLNRFCLSDSLSEPQLAELKIIGNSYRLDTTVFLGINQTTIVKFRKSTRTIRIKDGQAALDYQRYLSLTEDLDRSLAGLEEKYAIALMDEDVKAMTELKSQINEFRHDKHKLTSQFIVKNPRTQIANFILITTFHGEFEPSILSDALTAIEGDLRNQHDWHYLNDQVLYPVQSTMPGNTAPEFQLPDASGNMVSLADFKGQQVLIDFWSSSCVPCRKFNRELLNKYDSVRGSGIEILSISLDRDRDRWRKAAMKDGIFWTDLCDLQGFGGKVAKLYGINSIPANFLVDKNGLIVDKYLEVADLVEFSTISSDSLN